MRRSDATQTKPCSSPGGHISVWVLTRQTPVGLFFLSTQVSQCACIQSRFNWKARCLANQTPNHPTEGGLLARLDSLQSPSHSSGPACWGWHTMNPKPSWEQKRSSRNGEAGGTSSAEGKPLLPLQNCCGWAETMAKAPTPWLSLLRGGEVLQCLKGLSPTKP